MKATLTKYSSFEELKAPRDEKVSIEVREKRHEEAKEFIEDLITHKVSKTNSLTSHTPERTSHRVDKMSGFTRYMKNLMIGKSKVFHKKFASKKRRNFLKKETE
jgi:hypothetical protein